ncbi:MAG: hypothetical protein Q9M09_06520 [Mariprofundaceae bacterium]|nr:hypothetical protein [Mariprofundaceae bacterium]
MNVKTDLDKAIKQTGILIQRIMHPLKIIPPFPLLPLCGVENAHLPERKLCTFALLIKKIRGQVNGD